MRCFTVCFSQALSVLVIVAAFAGCSGQSNVSTVEGSITVDGKAVPSGTISFSPLDGGEATSADIAEGKYRAESVARGRNLVHLNAFLPTGGTFVEFGIEYPEEKNMIPAQYQSGIELAVDEPVVQHNFELMSR